MSTVVSSLAVEIGAEIAGLQRGLGQADKQIGGFVDRARQQTMALGAAMTAGVTLPLVGMAAAAAKTAIAWESAFAGVRKTVNATEQEFDALARGLRDMATGASGSPVAGLENAAVTLAGVAEAAGQLGVSKDYILEFTETMAMLGMATNLTAEEAATSLAQFANIVQMPLTEIDRLGSAIVALGNNSATTERDIVEFAQRLAGAGAGAGLTEANILALSAAMASVGLNAEAGGTAMTMVMNAITKAVAGGGAELEDFAALSGWSAEEFAQGWRGEPITALEDFIVGLSKLDNEQQILMLDQLGLDGIRVADTLRRMAGNTDVLSRSIGIANDAWGENNALVNEAEQRFMTTEAQLNLLGNNLKDVGITVGSILLPPINNLIAGLVPLLQGIGQLDPAIVQVGLAFVAAAAAAGPLLLIVGAMLSPVGLVAGGIAAAAIAIISFKDEIMAALPWLDDLLAGASKLFDMFGAGDAQQAADDAASVVQSVPKLFDVEIPAGQTVWDAWQSSYQDQFPDWQEFRGLAETALTAAGLTFTNMPGGGLSLQFPMGTEIVSAGGDTSGIAEFLPGDEMATALADVGTMSFGDKLREAFNATELSGIADSIAGPIDRIIEGVSRLGLTVGWFVDDAKTFGLAEAIRGLFGTGKDERAESSLEGLLTSFGVQRDKAIEIVDGIVKAFEGLGRIPETISAALSEGFGGGESQRMIAGGMEPGGGGIDLSGVQTWAEDNFGSILNIVALAAGVVLGGPAALAIGAAKLVASAIENDFLGIGTWLDTSGITAAVEGAFNSIVTSIRGIFTGGAASGRMVAGGADTGGGGGLLDGMFAGLTNFTPPDLSAIVGAIEGILTPLRTAIEGAWASIEPHVQPFIDGIKGFFAALQGTDTAGLDNVAATIGTIATAIFAGLSSVIGTLVDLGGGAIGSVLEGLGNALPLVGEGISGIVSAFSIAAETGDVGAALSSLGSGISNIGGALLSFGAGAADGLLEAIEKVTGLQLPDMATIGETLSTGLGALTTAFDNAKLAIDIILQGISTSITDNILTPVSTLWSNVSTAIQPFLEGIQTGIVDPLAALWDNVKAGVEAFWGNITQIFSTINADVIQPIRDAIYEVQTALNALSGGLGAWGSVGDNAGAAAGMVTSGQVTPGDFLGALGNAISMELGGGGSVPGFAEGISYVPGTMLAMLHGGERVLTRDENRAYRQGSGGGGATFNMTLYGASPFEVAQMVQRSIRDGDR